MFIEGGTISVLRFGGGWERSVQLLRGEQVLSKTIFGIPLTPPCR